MYVHACLNSLSLLVVHHVDKNRTQNTQERVGVGLVVVVVVVVVGIGTNLPE